MELNVKRYSTIPFKEKGRDFSGCDCWGIPYLIYRDMLNIELPLYTDGYQNTTDAIEIGRLTKQEEPLWERVETPDPCDIVLIRMRNQPMHCGVYIGNGRFIHCLKGVGTAIERCESLMWRDRILGYYRRK